MKPKLFLLLATLILLGSAFLRLADQHRYPPGLHYDEAADMLLSRDIAFYGYRPFPVVTAYSGREALFYYLAAPALRILGTTVFATRLTSAFLGILSIAVTIALGKVMFRKRSGGLSIALLAGAWFAVSGPEVWLSRQGFRTSPQPLLEALVLWLLWITLRRTQHWHLTAILGGICGGLTLYVYMAARVFPPWLALPLLILILLDRRWLRLKQIVVFFAAMTATALPIAIFYLTHLDVLTDRLSQLAPTADTPTLWQSLLLHLQMFFIQGDPLLRYNLYPGRPFFDPISGLLLLIGLALAAGILLRRRTKHLTPDPSPNSERGAKEFGDPSIRINSQITESPQKTLSKTAVFSPSLNSEKQVGGEVKPLDRTAAAFLLLCPLLIAPSVIAVQGLPPSHMRSVAMVPLIFFLPALALTWIGQRLNLGSLRYGLTIVLILGLGTLTWRDYQAWGERADLFYDSDGDLNLAANWLEHTTQPDSLMYIASKYYEHPTVLAHNVDPARIRWMMDDHVLIPPTNRDAYYVFPRSVPATSWTSLLTAMGAEPITDIPNGPDNAPAYQAYHMPAGKLTAPRPSIPLDANIGGILRLHGADLPTATSGETAIATLYWEVLRTPDRDDLAPVVTLVDAWNNEIVRTMPYFEYSGRWLPGEWIVEQVRLKIPAGNPPGTYAVKVAWIGKNKANDYLSILDANGAFAGIWTEIKSVPMLAGKPSTLSPTAPTFIPGVLVLDHSPLPAKVLQGEHLRFSVTWQTSQSIPNAPPLKLITSANKILWQGNPVHDTYPMDRWQPGEQVIDRYDIPIPADFPPGNYQITLTADGAITSVFTVPLQIQEVPREYVSPKLAHTVKWRFGDSISLIGYEVQPNSSTTATDNQQVTVKLTWQAISTPNRDYTVFVHVMNPDGTVFSQHDSPPHRPTSEWIDNEVVSDSYTLKVPPGPFTVTVGLYVQENGLRLPIKDDQGVPMGNEAKIYP